MIQGDNSWKSKMIENLRADLREEGSHEKGCMISHVKRAVQGTKRKKKKKTSVGSVLLLVLNKRVIILLNHHRFSGQKREDKRSETELIKACDWFSDRVSESVVDSCLSRNESHLRGDSIEKNNFNRKAWEIWYEDKNSNSRESRET